MANRPNSALRPVVQDPRFESLRERVWPFVEDAAVREQRRKEALAELVSDYEDEHGVITEDEILRLDSEWLA